MLSILSGEYMSNLVMPKEMYNFLLKMVEDGRALNVSDAIRKCIEWFMICYEAGTKGARSQQ